MSEFRSEIHTKIVKDGWELTQPVVYYSDYLDIEITVPKGFFTDLASVPRPMRILVPVANAKNRPAAIVHDYLCVHKIRHGINQKQADRVFREALRACGVSFIGIWGMWVPTRAYQWLKECYLNLSR